MTGMKNMESRQFGSCLVCQLWIITFPDAMELEHRLINPCLKKK
jgi:hypothetical protein